MKMPVEGGFGDREILGLDDVIQVLAFADTVRDNEVVFVEGFLGEGNTGSTLNQCFPVGLMCGFGQVFMFFLLAIPFASASIANERGFQQIVTRTRILSPGRDNLDVLLDLLGYGRGVFADSFGDTFKGNAMEQTFLNLSTIVKGEVLACAGVLF